MTSDLDPKLTIVLMSVFAMVTSRMEPVAHSARPPAASTTRASGTCELASLTLLCALTGPQHRRCWCKHVSAWEPITAGKATVIYNNLNLKYQCLHSEATLVGDGDDAAGNDKSDPLCCCNYLALVDLASSIADSSFNQNST